MGLIKYLSTLIRGTISQPDALVYPAEIRIIDTSGTGDLSETEYYRIYHDRVCPDCYSPIWDWHMGPSGGCSRNWRCLLCGMGYNLGGVMGERIGLPFHLWDSRAKSHRSMIRGMLERHNFKTSDNNWGIEKEGRYGIWQWPHNGFSTTPTNFNIIITFTWSITTRSWHECTIQLPDPEFIDKIDGALKTNHEEIRYV